MLKSSALIGLAAVVFSFFSGCSGEAIDFDGSRTSNESEFILDFNILNISVTHHMELQENDIIDVIIRRDKGELDLSVTGKEGQPIYQGDHASSGEFSLEITRGDTYEFEVAGYEASGFVSFVLRKRTG